MRLSKNLWLSEVIKSGTAIRNGILNVPSEEHLDNLKVVSTKIFQPTRDEFDCPIFISSGFRSVELNRILNGSSTSQHCKGEALDIDMDGHTGATNKEIFYYIFKELDYDQLIWEFGTKENPAWVHASYNTSGENRKETLIARTKTTKDPYKYVKFSKRNLENYL